MNSTLGQARHHSELGFSEMRQLWGRMLLIRAFDRQLPRLYTEGLIRGSSHAAIGQEAVAVGSCAALEKSDYISSTHRGHGHTIAKGGDVRLMMAELFGRTGGYCRGRGGSMHIADFSLGMLGANGIVGGGFGLAGGAALSSALRHDGRVALCFFGDGALNKGAFLEVGNLAAIWKLPLVLVCENNQYAMSGRVTRMTGTAHVADRATGLGIPGETVDGMSLREVHRAVAAAVCRARQGSGPSLVVAECYRYEGHFAGDQMKYRDRAEAVHWLTRDPIAAVREELVDAGRLTTTQADAMESEAAAVVEEAIRVAREMPLPDPATALEDVMA